MENRKEISKTFGKNLDFYLKKNKMRQRDLAIAMGCTYATVSNWVNGQRLPSMNAVKNIAKVMGVTTSQLLEGVAVPPDEGDKYLIPVLGKVQAGIPVEAVEDIIDYEEIPEQMARQGEYFGLQIRGDSMTPRFCENDIVIVKKQPDLESGDIGIILVDNNDATIKKVMKFEGGINLVPLNPVYDIKTYSKQQIEELPIQILGKVVELRAKF